MDGKKDWFSGKALSYAEEGISDFRQGRYLAAIENLEKAQRHRDGPSSVLENWIGFAYRELGQYPEAIQHHSASISIDDDATRRVNRGVAYLFDRQCGPAATDAKAALAMEPQSTTGIHSDAEANYILASCYAYDGQHLLALQHAVVALGISIESGYERGRISEREWLVEDIRQAIDPNQPDIDFFVPSALVVRNHCNDGLIGTGPLPGQNWLTESMAKQSGVSPVISKMLVY